MRDAEDLYDEWTDGDSSGVRPARVQVLRDALKHHTDMPIPRGRAEIESWLPRMKGQITRKLKEASGLTEDEADDEDDNE